MPGLPMDNTCDAIARVLLDSLPNAHDIAAGRVNNHTAFCLYSGTGMHFGTKSRDDDHILIVQS